MQVKILIVEDEKYIRGLYTHILKQSGHIVEEAENGEEAYDKIASSDYDLVLLDIMLPKMDGLQVLAKLQSEGKSEKIKQIVLLTNVDEKATFEQGVSYGVRGYWVKSQNPPEKLVEQISELLA
jgi:CheY-like chemotaxis protein